jgi:hypothetical protein
MLAFQKTNNESAQPPTFIKSKAMMRLPALIGSQLAWGRSTNSIGQ